jgi:uncharacterized protein YerC
VVYSYIFNSLFVLDRVKPEVPCAVSCTISSYNKCIASRNDGYALILSINL